MRENPIPADHRFPMRKNAMLFDFLSARNLTTRHFIPYHPDVDTLCLAHDRAYVTQFLDGTLPPAMMRRIGLPWTEPLVRRTTIGVGAALMAVRLAMQFGIATMCSGGTHHAGPDFGGGWCILNDFAVAARAIQVRK